MNKRSTTQLNGGEDMKVYDLIKKLLTDRPELRSSDKKLIWAVWEAQGLAKGYITKQDFLDKAIIPESVRRPRQTIQNRHPELSGGKGNMGKENMKGAFVFHERVPVFDDKNNTVRYV